MAYYPENRRASDAVSKLGLQIALDTASNVLKEFWPQGRRRRATKRGGEAGITKWPSGPFLEKIAMRSDWLEHVLFSSGTTI